MQRDAEAHWPQGDELWQQAPPAVSEGPGAGVDLVGPAPRALTPLPGTSPQQTLSIGLYPGAGERDLLACAWYEAAGRPRHEFIWLERRLLREAAGNLLPLVVQARQGAPFAAVAPWPAEARRDALQALLRQHDGELAPLLQLLAAALDERGLLLEGRQGSTRSRLEVVQGLLALLPAGARALLGFASNVVEVSEDAPAILFSDADPQSDRRRAGDEAPLTSLPGGNYVSLLAQWWVGDLTRLLDAIDGLGPFPPDCDLAEGLDRLVQQDMFARNVRSGLSLSSADIRAGLQSGLRLPAALLPEVLHRLLQEALAGRDVESARLVAQQMDDDPALDASLAPALAEGLQTRPDAVYVFARAHLSACDVAAPPWRRRLRAAALCSLQIAICEADAATVVNWLRLIALEPQHYGLADILVEGLLAARGRAHEDGELATQLLELAVRHAPDAIEGLMDDERLLAALPDNTGLVLRDHAGDPLLTLRLRGSEFFLVAIARATQARVAGAISNAVLEQTWLLYRSEQRSDLPVCYQPETIVDAWLRKGPEWLPASALGNLAALLLADQRDEFFLEFAARLAGQDMLAGALPDAAHRSQRSSRELVALFNRLPPELPRQIIADSCLTLLRLRAWKPEALPAAELVARLLQQDNDLRVGDDALWQLLDFAAATRDEMVARAAGRRLFQALCRSAADPQLAAALLRLQEALGWNPALQSRLDEWWRTWTRGLGMADLSRLDEALADSKALLRKREIVQTIMAFRRMLGAHDLPEFAALIDSVTDLLHHLAEAFDPRKHRPVGLDLETFRAELDASSADLSQNARALLAHDLRELGQLIGTMGDLRSHNTLVRPNIERQILSGEHAPESAVDALKWIAAWLENGQRAAARDNETPRGDGNA